MQTIDRALHLLLKSAAPLGQMDQASPDVGRIGFAVQVTVSFEVTDQLMHRLLGHPALRRQVGDAPAFDATEAEDLQMRGTQFRMPRRDLIVDLGERLLERQPEQADPVIGRLRLGDNTPGDNAR